MRASMAYEQSQGATMNGEPFDAKDFQAVAREQRSKRSDRKIENVFVIDGVEFGVLDKIDGIRKLEDNAAFGLEEGFQPRDEVVDVRGMGEDIVAEDEVGFFSRGGKFCGEVVAE